jgi:hypothetical protein
MRMIINDLICTVSDRLEDIASEYFDMEEYGLQYVSAILQLL